MQLYLQQASASVHDRGNAALMHLTQPTVQVTAATCEAAGTATITNYNEDYSYTFDPTGPLAGANGVISNMTYGTSYTA
jgi:hypothetical protein